MKSQIENKKEYWKLEIGNWKLEFPCKGQALIELILAMGLAALIFPTLLAGFMISREGKVQQGMRVQAVALLKESEQAVKSVRANDWTTFAINGTYHTVIANNKWTLVSGSQTVNGLTQQIDITDVNRDAGGAIVTVGGVNDPSTKKIVITISWTIPQSSSISSSMYLTRTGNTVYSEATFDHFNTGVQSNILIATTPGSLTDGQIQLGDAGGGGGDWCKPSFSITTVDLPKSGVANTVAAIGGPAFNGSTVFAGTGDNASGVSFAKIDVPGNPPTASTPATFDGYKTNSVFGESDYAYMTTDNNFKEVVMIGLSQYSDPPTNSKYKEVGVINLPGSVNGSSIYVVNNMAYITSSDKTFYVYSLSANRSIATQIGSLTLDGVGKKVLVAGDYAYIATDSTMYQLEIVKISNSGSPISPVLQGRLSLGTSQSGVDVYVDTSSSSLNRAYIVTSQSASHSEFYIVNVSNASSPNITGLSNYDTSGMTPTGLTVVTNNRAIIVGTGGAYQYQVVNISNEAGALTSCGNLVYATGIRGVSSVLQESGYAYSYVITGDANSELKIILGGTGGIYTSSGIFESAIYDPGYSVAYNRVVASVSQSAQTTLQMRVAVAPPVSGNCNGANFTYVGPNGDSSTYFTPIGSTISATIPFGNYSPNYNNPERCFRYKLWLSTTDQTQTPILYDLITNYSP